MKLSFPKGISLSALILGISLTCVTAQDNMPVSFDPPGGIPVDSCPIFIVLGFDDNRYADGMEWTLDILDERSNPAGTGNPATFDGTPLKAAFYHISGAMDEDDGTLLNLWKRAYESGHEVGNHTVTHNTSDKLTVDQWKEEMVGCRDRLAQDMGISPDEILGFRTPYLGFNEATYEALADLGMLYECSMTQHQNVGKKQFSWPYTLDAGFPAETINGWKGKAAHPGLWMLPAYTFGAWDSDDYPMWPPIVTFDHSILTQAYGDKFGEYLINAVDYRMIPESNRAPITVGLHTDVYSEVNTATEIYAIKDNDLRRKALVDFIDYALTFPQVRFVTGLQLIEWMRNPVPLGREPEVSVEKAVVKKQSVLSVRAVNSKLALTVPTSGSYSVELFDFSGRKVVEIDNVHCSSGSNTVSLDKSNLSRGVYLVKVSGMNHSAVSNIAL